MTLAAHRPARPLSSLQGEDPAEVAVGLPGLPHGITLDVDVLRGAACGELLRDSFVGDVGGIAVGDGRRRWGGLGVGVVVIAPGRAGAHGRVVAVGTGLGSRGVASRR